MDDRLSMPSAWPEDLEKTGEGGLTEAEAARRLAAGQGNRMTLRQGKSVPAILRDNVCTLFNLLNVALAVCLMLVGSYRNMTFLLVVLANIVVGTVQEYRAQQTIRKLQLMNAPQARVMRDGEEKTIPAQDAVRGDLAVFRAGDQVIADAVVMQGTGAAVEALLTGESRPVQKEEDSWLYSGSYVSEGKMIAQLAWVGDESYAGRLMREARKVTRPGSVLMREMRKLIRYDSIALIPLGILLFLKQVYLNHYAVRTAVPSTVAAMIGMIPEGLVLLTSVAMAVGVVRLGRRNALVQELAGIETLARVDVLCLDKTGTITTGHMALEHIVPCQHTEEETRQAISRLLGVFDEKSGTLDALRAAVTPGTETPMATLPFSSARKKSAATFREGEKELTLVMGAPEFVLGDMYSEILRRQVREWTELGRRVLVVASGQGRIQEENPPRVDTLWGMCVLKDEVRTGARETLAYFREQGVSLRLISGDDPRTVSKTAREAGVDGWDRYISAEQLKTEADMLDACEKYTVFGRVTPEQKKALVQALRKRGHNVAMTGDGVNDIPAMKAADCSIAMASGADAARHAAQVTLLDSNFAVMPDIVLEGRRVINNITRTASLFLTKTIFSMLLSVLMLLVPGTYPFQPIQMSLVSGVMVGVPGFFLALEPSRERIRGHFLKNVIRRALPGGVAVAVCASMAMGLTAVGWNRDICSTIATLLAGWISFAVLARTCWPLNWLRAAVLAGSATCFVLAERMLKGVFYLEKMSRHAWLYFGILMALGCLIMVGVLIALRKMETGRVIPEEVQTRVEEKTKAARQAWETKKGRTKKEK